MSTELLKPIVDIYSSCGDDGREPERYYTKYMCPKCKNTIKENQSGCVDCRVFFDWSKKAKVKTIQTIAWE